MSIKVRKGKEINTGLYDLDKKKYDKPLYKYMDMGAAIRCIKERKLRFVEPSCWNDQFEKLFYMATYCNVAPDVHPLLYANCFTKERMSEAAWQIYTHQGNGISANCVQFSVDVTKLREELASNIKNHPNWRFYEGLVDYQYDAKALTKLHLKNDRYEVRDELFSNNFSLDNFMTLLLLKRNMFEHEKEYRFFLIDEDTKNHKKGQSKKGGYKGEAKEINIDWDKVVTKISINKTCSDLDLDIFISIATKYGIKKDIIQRLDIYKKPKKKIFISIG
ncbi:MAG: hypothetical protein SO365_06710 [Prevotella sp.]|nr:hypothetical protein [Bacteroidales bacterium]MDY4706060.1 hypothetical protein [Prevotella sp.]MDY4951479.1 hypothetical protein [Prevotella sp.]